jgi:hypothetical protein
VRLQELQTVAEEKRAELERRKDAQAHAKTALTEHDAQHAAAGAAGGQDAAATRQQLVQAITAAGQDVTDAEAAYDQAKKAVETQQEDGEKGLSERSRRLAQMVRDVEELRRMEASSSGGPVKLEDIYYTGPEGSEQAIFLPVLKALIVVRCIVCVPTPAQIQSILQGAKQGHTLFPQEPVSPSEDIQQFAVRVKGYMLAAQLIGTPMDGAQLLQLGLRDKAVREKLELAMSVATGPSKLEDVARKAMDIQAKQESLQMMHTVRGLYSGKGALVAGGGASCDGKANWGAGVESRLSELAETVKSLAALAAGGFKQAGKFATGGNEGGGAGKDAGAEPREAKRERSGYNKPKCPKCGRRHRGECWPRHEACGRHHDPSKTCYGDNYRPYRRGGRREDEAAQGGAAAAGQDQRRVLTDEEVAAGAADGLNVWNLGGGCSVAALLRDEEDAAAAECLDDALWGGAVLAGGSLKQTPPAGFHQMKPGVLTRRAAARLAEQEADEEAAAAVERAAVGECSRRSYLREREDGARHENPSAAT